MLKNYVPSDWETVTDHTLVFDDGRGNGLCFYCDEDGNLLDPNPAALRNLEWAKGHPENYVRAGKFIHRERRIRTPAHGTCECGQEILLVSDYMGACNCPNCGRWYNLFGQELLPPEQWEEDW